MKKNFKDYLIQIAAGITLFALSILWTTLDHDKVCSWFVNFWDHIKSLLSF